MTVTVIIDGVAATVEVYPHGRVDNADAFVAINITPVAHMAFNMWLEKKSALQSV